MSSAAAGGTAVEYYSSVPTFIPPTSYSATGVPTFDPNQTPSPTQDLSSPPSSNHAHPSTPSPESEQAPNPYANDPWSPQLNQSIKIEPSLQPPKSPNLGGQRKMQSKFAVPAPSAGAAGYRPMSEYSSAVSLATSQRAEQEEFGLSPVQAPAVSVTPSDKSASSKGALSKSFARLSMSFSGRSKSGKKNSPPGPIDEPAPQPYSAPIPRPQHQRPVSFAGSTAPSTRPRSFVIPQTLEEWEAFNKAILAQPAPPPPQSQQRPRQQSTHLRPPSSSSSMLPGPRLAATLAASPGGSPRASPRNSPRGSPGGSPRNSPRRSVVDLPPLPPPPIVLGEWERKRLSEAQGIPFPQAPSPQQRRQTTDGTPPSSAPSSRPTSPVRENKRSSMLLFTRKSSGAVSPGAVNTTPTPFILPKTSSPSSPAEQSPSPSRVPSPNPVPLAAPAIISTPPAEPTANAAPVVQPAEPETKPEPEARPRTISLPDGPKTPRPHLAPIQTDVSSASLKWSRPKSWMGMMGGGGGGGDGGSRLRSMSTTDLTALMAVNRSGDVGDEEDPPEGEIRPRVISIERYNPNSNGARLRAMRKSSRNSSIDLTMSDGKEGSEDKRSFMSDGSRMRNLLRKRKPSTASESGAEGAVDNSKLKQKQKEQQPPQGAAMTLPPGARKPMLGKNYAVSPGAVSPSPAAEVESKDAAAPATPAGTQRSTKEKRRSRLFSFGSKNVPAPTQSMAAALAAGPVNNTGVEKDAAPAPAAPVVAPAAPAPAPADSPAPPAGTTAEKRRSRRFSFGVKNSATQSTTASPSPANDVEGDAQRRSRRFSFGMKNPFNKKESSASPAPAVNPHALLPPGAARPAILSRAGSQGTADTSSSSNVPSSTITTPPSSADSTSTSTSIKPPSPPAPSSPLTPPLVRSNNNSSTSLAGKINPFKRKPPPSLSDEPFVIVPTFNTGKGKLKLEISDAERERLERMSAPPSLPTSRPQTPSDLTVPVRLFGSGKRGSFFEDGDDADKEEKIDEKNNRVSRFLSEYAANNELGLAIPSPSLSGMPLAPSSVSDSTTNNSVAATDSTGHSDATARVKTPERFEY